MTNITSGKIPRSQKLVLYGPEGIGKTTFAAAFPDPVFIDTEGGTSHLDVRRTDQPREWKELLNQVHDISLSKPCKTLVIDTADWAEQLCVKAVCNKAQKAGIEDFGYGKGYVYLQEEFENLLDELNLVIEAGIHVVITAHAKMRKFEQPDEMGSYDRWEMKLTKQVAPMVKEWADMVLFANYKTFVVNDENGKAHVQGGKRVIYTTHHPCWDAKNRHGLPDEIPLDYQQIKSCIENDETPVEKPKAQKSKAPTKNAKSSMPKAASSSEDKCPNVLATMMRESDVLEPEVRKVFADKGYYPKDTPWDKLTKDGFIEGWIIPQWDKIVDTIKADPDRLPF